MDGGWFVASHAVPAGGMAFWHQPDAARPPDGRLDAYLPVLVVAETTGWAQVRCSNGWETWVDGRALVAPGAPGVAPGAPGVAAHPSARSAQVDVLAIGLPAGGAGLAILGGFLPWLSAPLDSSSAWDIPVKNLFDTQNVSEGLDIGPVLLVTAIALIPLLTRQALPRGLTGALGGLALVIALLGFRLYVDIHDLAPDIGFGFGLGLTLLGGILLTAGALRQASPVQP